MTHAERMKAIRERSPFPWRDEIHGNGLIKIFDANNVEVLLFDVVALALITTATLSAQPAKEAA